LRDNPTLLYLNLQTCQNAVTSRFVGEFMQHLKALARPVLQLFQKGDVVSAYTNPTEETVQEFRDAQTKFVKEKCPACADDNPDNLKGDERESISIALNLLDVKLMFGGAKLHSTQYADLIDVATALFWLKTVCTPADLKKAFQISIKALSLVLKSSKETQSLKDFF
jgi:hypothetical protein